MVNLNKYALAKGNGSIVYNLSKKDITSISRKEIMKGSWVVVTHQQHNPPDEDTHDMLSYWLSRKLKCKKEKIAFQIIDGVKRWVKLK